LTFRQESRESRLLEISSIFFGQNEANKTQCLDILAESLSAIIMHNAIFRSYNSQYVLEHNEACKFSKWQYGGRNFKAIENC